MRCKHGFLPDQCGFCLEIDPVYLKAKEEEEKKQKLREIQRKVEQNKEKVIQQIRASGPLTGKKILRYGLPGMPWLREAQLAEVNEPEQKNSQSRYSKESWKKLKVKWDEIGVSNWTTWKNVAEKDFGRSLYGIEVQLRFMWDEEIYEAALAIAK